MRIGIIREGKLPADKRTPFTPEHCSELLVKYPELHIQVQRSSTRCFDDIAYQQHGAELTDDVNNCDVIFGVKEVPYHMLAPGKTMFFFSHTIKQQPYNRELLREVLRQKVRLIDYETLTYPNGVRVLGFGRYAGIVGAYHAINAYGMRYKKFDLRSPRSCAVT
jgi:alanine dehydrogenase